MGKCGHRAGAKYSALRKQATQPSHGTAQPTRLAQGPHDAFLDFHTDESGHDAVDQTAEIVFTGGHELDQGVFHALKGLGHDLARLAGDIHHFCVVVFQSFDSAHLPRAIQLVLLIHRGLQGRGHVAFQGFAQGQQLHHGVGTGERHGLGHGDINFAALGQLALRLRVQTEQLGFAD